VGGNLYEFNWVVGNLILLQVVNSSHERILKNTVMLYFRMLFSMGVSLYTVRIILNSLGAEDYGIYNVVGGIVTLFAFLNSIMTSASQRFFSFELGRRNSFKLQRIFSLILTIYVVVALFILICSETIGLWFVNNRLVIPENRIVAANWAYQFSVFSFIVSMLGVPYNAIIIAYEKMSIYAYVGIIEALMKLAIALLLTIISVDNLILYAFLLFLSTLITTSIYVFICIKRFEVCRYVLYWNKTIFNRLLNFTGWNLVGSVAGIFSGEGINILLNMFFGPVINASRGIAFQVSGALNSFGSNFYTAVRPQIIKYYAVGDYPSMLNLVFQSSKFSYYLLLFFVLPVLFEADTILALWLKNLPEHAVLFTRLIVINALIDSLANPLLTAALATGNIRKYQIVVGSVFLFNLPLSYVFLKWGFPPEVTMIISIFISIIGLYLRALMLKGMVGLSPQQYFKKVIGLLMWFSLLACIAPIIVCYVMSPGILRLIVEVGGGTLSTGLLIYTVGLTSSEKMYLKQFFQNKFPIKFSCS